MEDELPKITFRRNRIRLHQRLQKLQQQKQTRDEESRVPPLPSITNLYSKEWDDLPELGGRESRTGHYGDSLPDLYIQREDAVESLLDTDDQSNNENSLLAAKRNLLRSKSMVEYSGKHLERDRMKFKRKKKKRMSVDMMRSKSNAILGELFAVNQSSDSDCIYVGHESPVKPLKGSEADSCDSDVPIRRYIRKPKCITISEDSELSDNYSDKVADSLSQEEKHLKSHSKNKNVLKEGKEKSFYSLKKALSNDRQSEEVPKLQNIKKMNIKTLQHQTDDLQDTAAGRGKESLRHRLPSDEMINSNVSESLNSRAYGAFDFLNSLKLPEIEGNAGKKLHAKCYVLLRDYVLDQGDQNVKCSKSDSDRHFMDILTSETKEPDNQDSAHSPDKSFSYSLKSNEYSDISDTDDDRAVEVPSKLVPNKELLKHPRLLSSYSDISEDSGTETNKKGLDPPSGTSRVLNLSQSVTLMTIQTAEPKHPVFLKLDQTSNDYSDVSDIEDDKNNNGLTERKVQFASESHSDSTKRPHELFINQDFQKQTVKTGYGLLASDKTLNVVEQKIICQTKEGSTGIIHEKEGENVLKCICFYQGDCHHVHVDENEKETAENKLMEEISDNESSCTRNYSYDSAEIEKFLDGVCSIISTPDSSDYSDNDEDDEMLMDRRDKRSTSYSSNLTGADNNLSFAISEIYHESGTSEEEETMLYGNGVPVSQQALSFTGKITCTDNCWKLTSESKINDEGEKSDVNEITYLRDLNKFDTELSNLTYVCNNENDGAESMQLSNDLLDCAHNTSMPYLPKVAPLTSDTSRNRDEENNSSVKHSSPVMPVLCPMILNLETSGQLPRLVKPYARKRKVRCTKTESHVKQPFSHKEKRYVSKERTGPEKLSKLGKSGMMLNQLCYYVKNYCCVSEYQSPKFLLPSTKMNILDECRVDECHNFSHFFYFLSHYCSKYIIPSQLYSFIYRNILFENGVSQSVIHCAHDFLTKLTSSCSATFELTWMEVESSVQDMMNSDLCVKTPEEVLQNEVFLELVLSVLKTDLYGRNLSSQREIHGSKVYKLLSTDVTSTNLKKVICFVQQVSHSMANNSTTDGLNSHLIKLLNILQEFITLCIEVSSSCIDSAKSMALDLRNIYTYLPNVSTRYSLLQSVSSELLLFYLCELILESRFDNTAPLLDITLESVISSFFKAVPQIDLTTPPPTPSDDVIVCFRELPCRYFPEQVEELAMLLYLIVKSYLKVTAGKLNLALRRRSLCSPEELQLESADMQILKNWSSYMNSLQKHLGGLSPCMTAQTNHFLILLECLADSV